MHCLDYLVWWGNTSATCDEADLALFELFSHESEPTITKVGYFTERFIEERFIADFKAVQVLSELFIGILLGLLIDLEQDVDRALLVNRADWGIWLAWWLAVRLVEDTNVLRYE